MSFAPISIALKMSFGRATSQDWRIAALVFAASGSLYAFTAWWVEHTQTPAFAYYDLLAEAFTKGQLHLEAPPTTADLTLYEGKWYLAFPPLPALLLLPIAYWGGAESLNTVAFSIIVGALNVALVYLILSALTHAGQTTLGRLDHLWLAGFLGVGSLHWYMALEGSVWFLAQICAFTFAALAVWLMIQGRHHFWAGLALGLALLARPNAILLWPVLAAIALDFRQPLEAKAISRRRLIQLLVLTAPSLAAVAGWLLYNWARFDNPLDFGYLSQNVNPIVARDLREHGQFSFYYFHRNVQAMLGLPLWDARCGSYVPDPQGLSVFITMPALVYLGRSFRLSGLALGCWFSLLSSLVILLTYYNTGWEQFGYRFSLDVMLPAIILIALGANGRLSVGLKLLILAGGVINAWGVLWWFRLWCPR